MSDILSKEEIDRLLDVIDENETPNENGKDRIYLFFDYLKELGYITGDITNPKIVFNYLEFRDLFTKANEVIERESSNEQIDLLKYMDLLGKGFIRLKQEFIKKIICIIEI